MEVVLVLVVATLVLALVVALVRRILRSAVVRGIGRFSSRVLKWTRRPDRRNRKEEAVYTERQHRQWMAYAASMVYAAGVDGWEMLPPEAMGRNRTRIVMQRGEEMRELINGEWQTLNVRRVGFSRNAPPESKNGKVPQAEKGSGLHWADGQEGQDAVKKALLKYRNDLVPHIEDDTEALKKLWDLVRGRMYDGQEDPFDKMNEFKGNQGQAIERIHKLLKNDVLSRKQQKELL